MGNLEKAGMRRWRRWALAVAAAGIATSCSGSHDNGAAEVPASAQPAIQPRAVPSTPRVTPTTNPAADAVAPTVLSPTPVTAPPAPAASPTAAISRQVAVPGPTGPPVPVDSATPALAACNAGMISFTPGAVGFSLSHWGFPVVLTNTSARTCLLYGYPGMAALSGTQVIAAQTGRGSSYIYQDPGPSLVVLAPGGKASFGLGTGENASGDPSCQRTTALQITLPDQSRSTTVPFEVDICPPLVGMVTAIQAGPHVS